MSWALGAATPKADRLERDRTQSVKKRFRDLHPERKAELGFYEPGPLNSITDVKGVTVGHVTIDDSAQGLHTGITAIWPRADVYRYRPRAAIHVIHGAGEMTGLAQTQEWGVLETPICLTSCLNVGRVYDAVVEYVSEKNPKMGLEEDVIIPVVAECDDSGVSRARERAVRTEHVREALDLASSGPVAEGGVGAGTGMTAFGFRGGIGTSSRVVRVGPPGGEREYRVGLLLNANFGDLKNLGILGRVRGREWAEKFKPPQANTPKPTRSVIVVVATDAPMRADQLRRLGVRTSFGLGRAGSCGSHVSGEITIAFTTSSGEPKAPTTGTSNGEFIHDKFLTPFYEAVVECVEEAVLNALVAGTALIDRGGREIAAFPSAEL